MAQHTYDNEAVQELLNWAKKMIETKNYPTERYQAINVLPLLMVNRIWNL